MQVRSFVAFSEVLLKPIRRSILTKQGVVTLLNCKESVPHKTSLLEQQFQVLIAFSIVQLEFVCNHIRLSPFIYKYLNYRNQPIHPRLKHVGFLGFYFVISFDIFYFRIVIFVIPPTICFFYKVFAS